MQRRCTELEWRCEAMAVALLDLAEQAAEHEAEQEALLDVNAELGATRAFSQFIICVRWVSRQQQRITPPCSLLTPTPQSQSQSASQQTSCINAHPPSCSPADS